MTTLPTREQIDNAQPLEFENTPRPVKRKRAVSIQLCYHGALVSFNFTAQDDLHVRELEQSIDTLLRREGWSGAAGQASTPLLAGPGKVKAQYVDPVYDGNGEACCPVHQRQLKQGKWGWYCSSKDRETGEYCNLKFKD